MHAKIFCSYSCNNCAFQHPWPRKPIQKFMTRRWHADSFFSRCINFVSFCIFLEQWKKFLISCFIFINKFVIYDAILWKVLNILFSIGHVFSFQSFKIKSCCTLWSHKTHKEMKTEKIIKGVKNLSIKLKFRAHFFILVWGVIGIFLREVFHIFWCYFLSKKERIWPQTLA